MALLETVGLAGHAATALVAVNLAVNTAHLAAAAGWIGGVVVLLAAAFPATRTLTEAERARALGPMMEAFSATLAPLPRRPQLAAHQLSEVVGDAPVLPERFGAESQPVVGGDVVAGHLLAGRQ